MRSLLAISLTFLAGACGGSGVEGSTTTAPLVGDVSLVRSGGLAGTTTTITVGVDGGVLVTIDSETLPKTILPEAELEALHDLIRAREFGELAETYIPAEGICCDRFSYTVSAARGTTRIESTTGDGVETPPALQQVIDFLQALVP